MSVFGGGKGQSASVSPSFTGLSIQTSVLGISRAIIYGKTRVAGNLLDYQDFKATPVASGGGKGGGGKGGGGKSGGGGTSYTYSATVDIALCEGPIAGIGQIWMNKEKTTLGEHGAVLFNGTYPQLPWSFMLTKHPERALGYQGLAHVAAAPLELGSSAQLPNLTWEIIGFFSDGTADNDANPALVCKDILSSPRYGSGFPVARVGSLTAFTNYARATGMMISIALNEQKEAGRWVQDICDLCNVAPVWSAGVLNFIPFGDTDITANGATYVAPSAPLFDLNNDDFITEGDSDPVVITRERSADQYNSLSLEFKNRLNSYNNEPVTAKDQAAIDLYGLREASPINGHAFCVQAAARLSAQLALQRQSIRNIYRFRLGFRYVVLDPMDLVTITEPNMGLDRQWVRITEIEETEDGAFDIVAEEYLAGNGTSPIYPPLATSRYTVDYNVDPGPANPPYIFEPPLQLWAGRLLEIWAAISGGVEWGGCEVWGSFDGDTYALMDTVQGGARQGVLTATLPTSTSSLDNTNTLSVNLAQSRGEMLSGTSIDLQLNNTLCMVDGELIGYTVATLTSQYNYNLTELSRGVFDTTKASHATGANFARLDQAIAQFVVDESKIGSTVYLKFRGFNGTRGGLQDLSTLPVYSYVIQGTALRSVLRNPTNVRTAFVAKLTEISWDAITDLRAPIDYEIRFGTNFDNAQILGRTSETNFIAYSDGTYWVSAHYQTPAGEHIYSAVPPSIVIAGNTLVKNVIATWDEDATGWSGTVSGGAIVTGGNVTLGPDGDMLGVADFLADTDFLDLSGPVSLEGYYEVPTSHQVGLTYVAPCLITMNWTVSGNPVNADFLNIADMLAQTDFVGAVYSTRVSAQPQIAISQDGTNYAAWQNFSPGSYMGKKFKFRMYLTSSDPDVVPVLTAWSFSVDVPDRVDTGTNVAIAAGGTTITYATQFNVSPNVQITIRGATAGDDVSLTALSATGFTVQILNGGSGVARNIDWVAQGY